MKKLILLITISSLFSCGKSNKTTDLEKQNLKGEVQKVSVREYKADKKFGDIVKGDLSNYGNYNQYLNESGNLMVSEDLNEKLEIGNKWEYIRNNRGEIDEIILSSNDSVKRKWLYYYEDGILKEILRKNNSGELELKESYVYNNSPYPDYIVNINPKGDTLGYSELRHNNDGLKLEEKTFNGQHEQNSRKTWDYNTEGSLIEMRYYREEGLNDVDIYEEGYIKKSVSYDEGEKTGDFYTFKYEFDDQGNWTKRTSFMNSQNRIINEPLRITIREIQYH